MKREIKFRGKRIDNQEWVYGDIWSMPNNGFAIVNDGNQNCESKEFNSIAVIPESIGQFTGIKDKKGVDVYEGDFIRWRIPVRTTQTHYGDNIPNGSYTEPMEPGIEEKEEEVVFKDGLFTVDDDSHGFLSPIAWLDRLYDEESIKDAVAYWKPELDFWDDPEEGNLQYLLSEFKLKNLDELIEYVSGIEVAGNIHDELLS